MPPLGRLSRLRPPLPEVGYLGYDRHPPPPFSRQFCDTPVPSLKLPPPRPILVPWGSFGAVLRHSRAISAVVPSSAPSGPFRPFSSAPSGPVWAFLEQFRVTPVPSLLRSLPRPILFPSGPFPRRGWLSLLRPPLSPRLAIRVTTASTPPSPKLAIQVTTASPKVGYPGYDRF